MPVNLRMALATTTAVVVMVGAIGTLPASVCLYPTALVVSDYLRLKLSPPITSSAM